MQQAIDETERRRTKQQAFNKQHNIVPKTIFKSVTDILEISIPGSGGSISSARAKVAEPANEYKAMTPKQAAKALKQLEEKMYQHAKNLEFEDAARIRDQIKLLQAEMVV
jgi:excinuclease ABC subunit B